MLGFAPAQNQGGPVKLRRVGVAGARSAWFIIKLIPKKTWEQASIVDPWSFGTDPDADPYLWLTDPDADPDPAIFVNDLQDVNKKLIFSKFFCLLLFEGTFTSFFKDKILEE